MSMVSRRFAGYNFDFVAEIRPATDDAGNIIEYTHQLGPGVRRNRYGSGPFCRFRVAHSATVAGVYAVAVQDELKYIGECESLSARFGPNGYGKIAARNCHSDGQATNCRINALILSAAKAGEQITLWFHPSSDYKPVEAELIDQLRPPWNIRRQIIVSPKVPLQSSGLREASALKGRHSGATAEVFRRALEQMFAMASAQKDVYVRVNAGDLHRTVGGYPGNNHRMPACCQVMRSMMLANDTIVYAPPKGAGARLTIEYTIPRH